MPSHTYTTAVIQPLFLRYIDGLTWGLTAPFTAVSETLGTIIVPEGFVTDFNSIPRVLWNILPPDEDGEAAVLHDYLYRYGRLFNRPLTRLQCDTVHREFVHYRHEPAWKERAIYWGLRVGGWVAWKAYRKHDPKI